MTVINRQKIIEAAVKIPRLFLRIEIGDRYLEVGPIEEPQPRDDPPVNVDYPMQVYAEHVGFIHREDER